MIYYALVLQLWFAGALALSGELFSGRWPQPRSPKGKAPQPLKPLDLDLGITNPLTASSVKDIDDSLLRIMNGDGNANAGEDEDGGETDTGPLSLSTIRSPQATTFPVPTVKNLAIYYLQTELKLSEATLMNVIIKYSWVMYLKVETNLKPTVEVFNSFGFKMHHICTMVSVVPSVLAINHNWTLPEKLISIQKMFDLSRGQLVKLCVQQPLLLTSSIDRNMAVASFLREGGIGLSGEQLRTLLQASPKVAMTGLPTLKLCWSVLTSTYGLSPREARRLIVKNPLLLSQRMLQNGPDKLSFLIQELGLGQELGQSSNDQVPMSAVPDMLRNLVVRYPALLYLDTNVFLRPNLEVLRRYLELGPRELQRMLGVFPQLLGYNPASLERQCAEALWLLTGDPEYEKVAEAMASLRNGGGGSDSIGLDAEDGEETNQVLRDDVDDGQEEDYVSSDEPWGASECGVDAGTGTGPAEDVFATRAETNRELRRVPTPSSGKLDIIGDLLHIADNELKRRIEQAAATAAASDVEGSAVVGRRRLLRSLAANRRDGSSSSSSSSSKSPMGSGGGAAFGMAMEIEATRLLLQACDTLVLSRQRAMQVICAAPWVLSYRPERSKKILATLSVSLGMCRDELSHCVALYPRLLSLSVDTKISDVLRSLTNAATKIYVSSLGDEERGDDESSIARSLRQCHDAKSLAAAAEGEASLAEDLETAQAKEAASQGVALYDTAAFDLIYARRRHTIRSMVRATVLRYPLILGTSMERIDGRLAEIHSGEVEIQWPELISFIRRDQLQHARWHSREEGKETEEVVALERQQRAQERREATKQAAVIRADDKEAKREQRAREEEAKLKARALSLLAPRRPRGRPRKDAGYEWDGSFEYRGE